MSTSTKTLSISPPQPTGIAGAFTYVCLHPLDTIKTKMQTQGASQIYWNAFDAVVKTFQASGILGFYSGVSAVIVGSTASSTLYFGTCEFGKSILSKFENYPFVLVPPPSSSSSSPSSSSYSSAPTLSSDSSTPLLVSNKFSPTTHPPKKKKKKRDLLPQLKKNNFVGWL